MSKIISLPRRLTYFPYNSRLINSESYITLVMCSGPMPREREGRRDEEGEEEARGRGTEGLRGRGRGRGRGNFREPLYPCRSLAL